MAETLTFAEAARILWDVWNNHIMGGLDNKQLLNGAYSASAPTLHGYPYRPPKQSFCETGISRCSLWSEDHQLYMVLTENWTGRETTYQGYFARREPDKSWHVLKASNAEDRAYLESAVNLIHLAL